MTAPPSIGISYDLAASESGVACWSSDDEVVAWIEDVPGIDKPLLRDGMFDHDIDQVFTKLLVGDVGAVLCGDEDGVDADGNDKVAILAVLYSHLDFPIRTNPPQ
jgi:hypothetical protein